MNSANAAYLAEILSNSDIFLLIFVRMIGFIIITPVIGGRNIPIIARVGFSMALAGLIYSSGMITEVFYYDTAVGYLFLLIKEFVVGYIIGFVVYVIFSIMYLSGFITDQQIGFSMANVFDPMTNSQVPITGNLYYFMICVFFIITNSHHFVIKSLFYSYKALPIGSAVILGNDKLFYVILELMISFFKIGVSVALPIIGVILVLDIILGILVKVSPQMNVFVIGMPAKIFAGLLAIWLVIPMFSYIYSLLYNEINKTILNVIKVLMP